MWDPGRPEDPRRAGAELKFSAVVSSGAAWMSRTAGSGRKFEQPSQQQ